MLVVVGAGIGEQLPPVVAAFLLLQEAPDFAIGGKYLGRGPHLGAHVGDHVAIHGT
ncbi:hypothetical protein FHR95_000929 [Halomonas fontilapidosi]|uniref:Uncharacterized protein n=1 Tax=Halomonas fontilapidosi TaxID=616675 RepID=A0A7W5DJK2_9GAMM|nr:hypothetical protein [Halomonas fontilapidosi]